MFDPFEDAPEDMRPVFEAAFQELMTLIQHITGRYEYDENGLIMSNCPFKGQKSYVPYFWALGYLGFSDACLTLGSSYVFNLTVVDKMKFKDLRDKTQIVIICLHNGKVVEGAYVDNQLTVKLNERYLRLKKPEKESDN